MGSAVTLLLVMERCTHNAGEHVSLSSLNRVAFSYT
jgi:hypothetical protein